jgi:putative nucleotidyltransferase with HDIG domain
MKILIVDDDPNGLHMLQVMLKGSGYEVFAAENGQAALKSAGTNPPDLIISDILMPVMDGYKLCHEWKKDSGLKNIPFVFYTATYTDPRDEKYALSLGAERFIPKPVEPEKFIAIIDEVVRACKSGKYAASGQPIINETAILKGHYERMAKKLGDKVLELEKANIELKKTEKSLRRKEKERKQTFGKLQKSLEGTINALASAMGKRDPYTAGHQRRVAKLARAIAEEMGLSKDETRGIRVAGRIHDIGKISVPAEILVKPGRLTDIEFSIVKTHSQVGYDILKDIEFPWPVAEIVLQHHERMDGSGYPQGLSGEKIILGARIMAVADVVEAMSSHRPYRPAFPVEKVLKEISQNRGILYDTKVVDACLKLFKEKRFRFDKIV